MSKSTIESVRDQLLALPVDSFVRVGDLIGERAAVTSALSRIAVERESAVLRVRRGLYWRTEWTRFGPSRPGLRQIVKQITPPSTGPAGLAAVHALQLTTQVPGTVYFAVPGRAPRPIWGVKFLDRPLRRAELDLQWLEIALLEIFRGGRWFIEVDWPYLVDRIRKLSTEGWIRLDVVSAAAEDERHSEVCHRLAELADQANRGTSRGPSSPSRCP